jgi:hypothetical protein
MAQEKGDAKVHLRGDQNMSLLPFAARYEGDGMYRGAHSEALSVGGPIPGCGVSGHTVRATPAIY